MSQDAHIISYGLRALVSLLVVFGILLLFFYVIKRFMKTNLPGVTGGEFIKVLGTRYIGYKRYISLIEVPGSILVLGICGDNMVLLSKIDDEGLMEKVREVKKKSPLFFSEKGQKR